jgi:CubicO group peptidase (beta-lactamase class C family)
MAEPDWQARLGELALATGVPGASLAIWAGGREMLAACGVLSTATQVAVTPDAVFQIGQLADQAPDLFTGGRITLRADSG